MRQPSTSPSIGRIGVAVLLVASMGWAARNVWWETAGSAAPAAGTAEPVSAADRRQREILEQAVGYTPDPALVRVYDALNARHFAGRLPAIPVVWEPRLADVGRLADDAFRLEGMFGHIGNRAVILLNPGLAHDDAALRRALSHEMVHAWLYTIGDPSADHGPAFQATLKRLADEGAFTGLSSSDQERASLRAWLESEEGRLTMLTDEARREGEALSLEARDIEQAFAELNARPSVTADDPAVAAWRSRRDTYNRRLEAFRARADRHHQELAAFNAQVERYNLMASYPGGVDVNPLAAGAR